MFMRRHIQSAGFMPPAERVLGRERRNAAIAELVTTIALGLCTLVAVTVVSVGIARADVTVTSSTTKAACSPSRFCSACCLSAWAG